MNTNRQVQRKKRKTKAEKRHGDCKEGGNSVKEEKEIIMTKEET